MEVAHVKPYICNVNINTLPLMNSSIIISDHVINTINSLPAEDRNAIAQALATEMILGCEAALAPVQKMLYSVIRFYVKRDSSKYRHHQGATALCEL